jgi:hypothetical protein
MRSPLPNIAFSSGLKLVCSRGVLDKATAKSAPAVADTIATPVMPTQNQSQRPDFACVDGLTALEPLEEGEF